MFLFFDLPWWAWVLIILAVFFTGLFYILRGVGRGAKKGLKKGRDVWRDRRDG